MDAEESELVGQLRQEVLTIKECIAKYTIQCLAFSTAAVGAILTVQVTSENATIIGLAAVLACLVLRAVSRTAVHKLGTINRNLGYEMHLQRSRRLSEQGGWRDEYRTVGWEEAMRAWRVVQASVFSALCEEASGLFGVGDYRSKYRKLAFKPSIERKGYLWYDVRYLVAAATTAPSPRTWDLKFIAFARTRLSRLSAFFGLTRDAPVATYHAGSYVRKMLVIIHRAMFACLVPPFIVYYHVFLSSAGGGERYDLPTLVAALLLPSLTFLWICVAAKRDIVRLDQLESGILSIHSCAVIWQAVVVAHFRALSVWRRYRDSPIPESDLESGYTYNLALQAARLAKEPLRIHQWILDGLRPARTPVNVKAEIVLEGDEKLDTTLVDLSDEPSSHPAAPPSGTSTSTQSRLLAGMGLILGEAETKKLESRKKEIKKVLIKVRDDTRTFEVKESKHHFFKKEGAKISERLGLQVWTDDASWKQLLESLPRTPPPGPNPVQATAE